MAKITQMATTAFTDVVNLMGGEMSRTEEFFTELAMLAC